MSAEDTPKSQQAVVPCATTLALLPARHADDVVLAQGDAVHLAWSEATLDSERVLASRWTGKVFGVPVPLVEEKGVHCFRPTVAAAAGGVFVAGAARRGHIFEPVGMFLPDGGKPTRFTLDAAGDVFHLSLAALRDKEGAWIAWEERRGTRSEIRLGRLDSKGNLEPVQLPADTRAGGLRRRWPTLAICAKSQWLCWIEAEGSGPGRVVAASVGGDVGPVIAVDAHPAHQEAPAITLMPDGRPAVAWHSRARGQAVEDRRDVTRWIRLAVLDDGGAFALRLPPEHSRPGGQADAGVDQGWEFPELACTPDGLLWIAGRSSHGYHVCFYDETLGFCDRLSLSTDFWGGRGRRHGLSFLGGHGVIFARREPDGITLAQLTTETVACDEESAPPSDAPAAPEISADLFSANLAPSLKRGREILFGDLHQHSALSDGASTPEELYRLARGARKLDFAAITDHDSFCRRAIGPASWAYQCAVTDAFYEPGRFVTFAAYEFTGARHPGPGHKCVYFLDDVPECLPEKNVEAVFKTLRELGGFAAPHHVAWTGADMEHHDPQLQPVWEICSVHGCYEREGQETQFPPRTDPILPGHFIKDALDAGHRFGFIGSTDSHGLLWHHGICRKENPFSTGLAGVVGADKNRASIMAAMQARRTYATTGARIQLFTEFDGAAMGSEVAANVTGDFGVFINGTAAIQRVVLVRAGSESVLENKSNDPAKFEAAVAIVPDPSREWDYMYIKVTQEDGEMAWSSPIWLG